MGMFYLSRKFFSVTAVALPLTLLVPADESLESTSGVGAPATHARDSVIGAEPGLAPAGMLVVQDASGAVDEMIPLNVMHVTNQKGEVSSLTLICSQGGLTVSDGHHSAILADKDHIIDITGWSLPDLTVSQTEKSERRVLLTFVARSGFRSGVQSRSEVSNIAVDFRSAHESAESTVSRDGSPRNGVPLEAHVLASDVFVAEIPSITPLRSSSIRQENDHGLSGKDGDGDREEPNAPVSTDTSAKTGSRPAPRADVGPFVARAKALIQRGDISSARLLLEHARAHDAAEATFLLAQTYDPDRLRAWNVQGLRADPGLARSLYARAAEQGRADERVAASTRSQH